MKISYVNDQLLPDDATDTEQFMQTLSALARAGVDVTLCLPAMSSAEPVAVGELESFYQVKLEVRLQQFLIKGARSRVIAKLFYPLLFCRWQRHHDQSGVILHTRNLPTVCAMLLLLRLPVVYETYRPWHKQVPLLRPVLRWITSHPRLMGVITHSEYTRQVFLRYGCTSERVRTIYNGFDPQRLKPRLDVGSAKKHLNIDEKQHTIVYTGHIARHKGCEMILRLARELPDVMFFLIGSTAEGPVEKEAASITNVQIVKWLSYAETRIYLFMADILLIPPTVVALQSGRTVLPIKTFTYMAAGRAILAPRLPDIEEILTHGENAWLVEPDNLLEAVNATRELLECADLREKLALKAQHQAYQHHSYTTRADNIISFIQARNKSMVHY